MSPTHRLAWALCVVLFAWGFPRASEAAIRRYAVIVGNDLGAPGEEPLRYATSDARKIAEVLTSLGSVPKENLVLFENASAGDVERALIAVNDRIRVEQDRGDEAVLVVYYSGHADARALHMGRTRLDLDRMRRLVRGSAATFRLLILDACRSGALTRAKGARRIPPFALGLDEQLPGEGVVFMTASAAHEEAQESDEIRGSFFTHHLVSGLRGAADADGDGVVSVSEAYDHAYAATIRATSRSQYGTQHPHFQFDFRGQGRIALTRLRIERSGALVFPRDRSYIVFRDDARGAVIGEVGAAALRRTLLVESGTYFIRGRATDHLLEGTIEVAPLRITHVEDRRLERIEYARWVRKGDAERRRTHGPQVAYQLRSPLWKGSAWCHGPRVGYPVDLRWLTVAPRVGWCRSTIDGDPIHTTADELDVELQLSHVFDVPVVSFGLGVSGGLTWLRQSFTTTRLAPPRHTVGGHVDAFVDLWWDLPRGFYMLTEVAFSLYAFSQQLDRRGTAIVRAVPTMRGVVGVGKRF